MMEFPCSSSPVTMRRIASRKSTISFLPLFASSVDPIRYRVMHTSAKCLRPSDRSGSQVGIAIGIRRPLGAPNVLAQPPGRAASEPRSPVGARQSSAVGRSQVLGGAPLRAHIISHAVPEVAVLRTLHDGLRSRELNIRAPDLRDVIVSFAEQNGAEFGL